MRDWSAPHLPCRLEEHAIGSQPRDIDALIADRLQIGGKVYVAALRGFCAHVVVSGGRKIAIGRRCGKVGGVSA
jgi:hypothetical protein